MINGAYANACVFWWSWVRDWCRSTHTEQSVDPPWILSNCLHTAWCIFLKMGNESSKSNGGFELNGNRRGSASEEKRAQLAMAAEARIKKNTANDVSKAKRVTKENEKIDYWFF